MAQETLVYKLTAAQGQDLEGRLAAGDFEHRTVPHARFSVKGHGVVATLYESGKLVVQGAAPELFLARFTELSGQQSQAPKSPSSKRPSQVADEFDTACTWIGSDETGKGDYFGPLVVAAVRLDPEHARQLGEWGVADSKTLTDARAMQLAALLRERVPYAIRALDPPDYNRAYARVRGLNQLLAEQHASVIRELAQPGVSVLVDQFAHESVMRKALGKDTLAGIDLHQAHRAERHPAVAAASVLARQEFLVRLHELSAAHDVTLAKGAGAPVDRAGVEFARRYGLEALEQVAKVHFKNTSKIEARLG